MASKWSWVPRIYRNSEGSYANHSEGIGAMTTTEKDERTNEERDETIQGDNQS